MKKFSSQYYLSNTNSEKCSVYSTFIEISSSQQQFIKICDYFVFSVKLLCHIQGLFMK